MKVLLLTAALVLVALPALSQGVSRSEDQDYSRDRRDTEIDRVLRELGEDGRGGGLRRGAGFLLRSGDVTVAVRCDPRDSMRACVDVILTLLEKAKAAAPSPSR